MQPINNDMEELFRRAAEGYPLNTDSADWNAVAKKLSEKHLSADGNASKNKKYKHLLWLLLLLPFVWVYRNFIFNNNGKQIISSSKNMSGKTSSDAFLSKKINSSNVVKPQHVLPNESSALVKPVGIKFTAKAKLAVMVTNNNSTSFAQNKSSFIIKEPEIIIDKKEEKLITEINTKDISESKNEVIAITSNDSVNYQNKTVNKNNAIESIDEGIGKNMQKKPFQNKDRGLYAGIIISPDISTVKFQTVKNIGFSVGLIIGYQLNKKLSLESGILWDKKFYYSDGKYFSTKRVYTNSTAQIKNVDGACKMIEVPLIIKYNLTTGKTIFSASAGLSSYFMKSETYDYNIERSGQQYQRYATYKNSSTNLLAVANFGFGYNRALKKNIILRIEPYVKIPLKGIGIGSLPIMSSGVNIALIKKLYGKN